MAAAKNRNHVKEHPMKRNSANKGWQGIFEFRCIGSDGTLKWAEARHNALIDEGEQQILDVYLRGAAAPAGFYLGLTSMATLGETTTLATLTNEPAGNGYARQAINRDATADGWPTLALDSGDYQATGKTVTFTASGAGFGPVDKAFMATTSDATGKLVSFTALSQSRTLAAGDTLQVTYRVKLQ